MKFRRIALMVVVVSSILLVLGGCKAPSAEVTAEVVDQSSASADSEGNIYIVNQSKNNLLFYHQENGQPNLLKKIPAAGSSNVQPFLVNVPTNGNESRWRSGVRIRWTMLWFPMVLSTGSGRLS